MEMTMRAVGEEHRLARMLIGRGILHAVVVCAAYYSLVYSQERRAEHAGRKMRTKTMEMTMRAVVKSIASPPHPRSPSLSPYYSLSRLLQERRAGGTRGGR